MPQNRSDYEKVVVTNTITGLGSMMLRSVGGMWWIRWRRITLIGLHTIMQ
ncbi:MAG: hypothetical protein LBF27_24500 [Sphingobacterium sp.]|nr:hypothetical protein [Sphingobacterium sp.]